MVCFVRLHKLIDYFFSVGCSLSHCAWPVETSSLARNTGKRSTFLLLYFQQPAYQPSADCVMRSNVPGKPSRITTRASQAFGLLFGKANGFCDGTVVHKKDTMNLFIRHENVSTGFPSFHTYALMQTYKLELYYQADLQWWNSENFIRIIRYKKGLFTRYLVGIDLPTCVDDTDVRSFYKLVR